MTPNPPPYYQETDFQVYPTPNTTLHIRVNQASPQLDTFFKTHKTWCFLTAWNPYPSVFDIPENKKRNQQLATELQAKGLPYYEGAGVPDTRDWTPEASFLVLDLSEVEAVQLGQAYGQKAVVWGVMGGKARLLDDLRDWVF